MNAVSPYVRALVCSALFLTLHRTASAQGTAIDTTAILQSARSDIAAANAAWIRGLRQRNAVELASVYTDSGLFISADGPRREARI
jgi:hypothetical protein